MPQVKENDGRENRQTNQNLHLITAFSRPPPAVDNGLAPTGLGDNEHREIIYSPSGFEGNLMCTRVLWNDNKLAVLAGRTMDWPESTEPILTVAPRDYQRHGGKLGPLDV